MARPEERVLAGILPITGHWGGGLIFPLLFLLFRVYFEGVLLGLGLRGWGLLLMEHGWLTGGLLVCQF